MHAAAAPGTQGVTCDRPVDRASLGTPRTRVKRHDVTQAESTQTHVYMHCSGPLYKLQAWRMCRSAAITCHCTHVCRANDSIQLSTCQINRLDNADYAEQCHWSVPLVTISSSTGSHSRQQGQAVQHNLLQDVKQSILLHNHYGALATRNHALQRPWQQSISGSSAASRHWHLKCSCFM